MIKPWAAARASLPLIALAILVGTLHQCMRVARAAGHDVGDVWSRNPPVISALGDLPPEHAWFGAGFTLLAVVMVLVLGSRTWMLARDGRVRASAPLRWSNRITALIASSAMVALLIMAWIPDSASPIHFIAALCTFGLLAIYELAHAAISITLARRDDAVAPNGPGVALSLWFFVCPLAALGCVYAWIAMQSSAAQYAAVGLQFAYFIPLSPTLHRA